MLFSFGEDFAASGAKAPKWAEFQPKTAPPPWSRMGAEKRAENERKTAKRGEKTPKKIAKKCGKKKKDWKIEGKKLKKKGQK